MRKSISLVLICICLACSGCANGYISQDNTSRDITESSGIVEHSVNADEQAEEYVIVDFDDHINLLTPSDVHNTVNQTREESLLGIAYSVPSDWINGSDMIKDNYIGRQYYKDSTIEKDWYIEICYAGLEEGALGTDKAIERLIEGAKSIEDVSSFSSSETVVDNTDAYYYSCYYERKYYEDAYAIPIGDYGILCLFYDRISNDTDIETEFSQLIESIKIPDIDYVRSNYTSCVNTVYDGVTDKDPAEASGEVFDSEPENEPDTEKPSSSNSERDGFDDTLHSYYTGISAEGASEADAVAKQIATEILNNPDYVTDLDKVSAAAKIVSELASQETYGMDNMKYYRSPYGVFVAGVYTCAGTARALGRVLDFMGYSWEHTNENQNRHQWCVLTMDGQIGYADGMAGIAGYGVMKNGMTLPDGSMLHFAE